MTTPNLGLLVLLVLGLTLAVSGVRARSRALVVSGLTPTAVAITTVVAVAARCRTSAC